MIFPSLYHPTFNTNPFKHKNPNWKNSNSKILQHGEYYEKINVYTEMNNKDNNFKYSNLINLLQILMNFIYVYLMPVLYHMKNSNPWDITWSDNIDDIKKIDMPKIINNYKTNRQFVFHTNKAILNMLIATEIYKDLMRDVNKEHERLFPKIKIMNKEDEYSLDKFLWTEIKTEINNVYCCKLPSFDHIKNIAFIGKLNESKLNKLKYDLNYEQVSIREKTYYYVTMKITYYKLYYYFIFTNFYMNMEPLINQHTEQVQFLLNNLNKWFFERFEYYNSVDHIIREMFDYINYYNYFIFEDKNAQKHPQIIRKVSDGVNESAYLDIKPIDFELFF